jgi:hypothetical protein
MTMERRPHLFFFLLSALLPLALQAADTLTVEQKIYRLYIPSETFRTQVWQNPAINYYSHNFSFSTVRLDGFRERRGDASLTQQGNGNQGVEFQTESFLQLTESSRIFGKATYRNEEKQHIRWNENDDFDLITPYVTGDSIGGYLKGEEYGFTGGCAYAVDKWTVGGKLDYRAAITYRLRDPRPKNIVSDLNLSFALAREFVGKYRLGVGLYLRNYNQKGDVSYLGDKGKTSVYHLLGLGVDYVRFSGDQSSVNYDGWGMGGSIDFIPFTSNGLSVSLSGNRFTFKKELTGLNYAPIVGMNITSFQLETAWMHRTGNSMEYGIKLNAASKQREGTENIFGDPTGNVYPVIASISSYTNVTRQVSLTGVIAALPLPNKWGASLLPHLTYRQTQPEYKAVKRFMEISALEAGLDASTLFQVSKFIIVAKLNAEYSSNIKKNKQLTGLNTNSSLGKVLLSEYDYLSDDFIRGGVFLRGDYSFSQKNTLSLTMKWQHEKYKKCGNATNFMASVGLVF